MRWGPAKQKTRIKVKECGAGVWDDHGLDYPHDIKTTDFKVTGTGHERIEAIYRKGCANGYRLTAYDPKQPEQRIAQWLCEHACSFVMIDTKARATVIGFERDDDADAFRASFVE